MSTAYAKEVSDVWLFENKNVPIDFIDYFESVNNTATISAEYLIIRKSVISFTNTIVPREFNVPLTLKTGENIEYFFPNINNKSIQYVSFIETKHLKAIGSGYIYKGGSNFPSDSVATFKGNEIRKIYWNTDDFYVNPITIENSVFQNNKLQSLNLPTKVISMGTNAFQNNEIVWIEGWDNVTTIGANGFDNNKLVSSLPNGYVFELPPNLGAIADYTFRNNNLTYVEIPEKVASIGQYAFANNPITTMYFKNSNTTLHATMLAGNSTPAAEVTFYGHGEKSTAKTFAATNGYTYVNVDTVEHAVFDAEETMTTEKLTAAYEEVNKLEESQLKTNYLNRLAQVTLSFEVENYVVKAERDMTKEAYKVAVGKVNTLDEGILKKNYLKRLDLVSKAINAGRLVQIKETLIEKGTTINYEELEQLIKEAIEIGDAALVAEMEAKKVSAYANSYIMAKQFLENTETYPTFTNVYNTQRAIDFLPNGYTTSDTTGSKQELQDRLDIMSPKVYANKALELVEEKLTQAAIDDARVLIYSIKDPLVKAGLLAELEELQKKLNKMDVLFTKIDSVIKDYEKYGLQKDYDKAVSLIETLDHEELERTYLNKLYSTKYVSEVQKIIASGEVNGLTAEDRINLITSLALVGEDHPKFDALFDKTQNLIEEYDHYKVDYLDIMKKIDAIDITDPKSLTQETYATIRQEVFGLELNNPYKEPLLDELSKLQLYLANLKSGLTGASIIQGDISYVTETTATLKDIQSIVSNINSFDEAAVRKMLRDELDAKLNDLVTSKITEQFTTINNNSYEQFEELKTYIDQVNNQKVKNELLSQISEIVNNSLSEKLNILTVENLIKDNFKVFGESLENLKAMMTTSDLEDISILLDDKISNFITNNYNDSSAVSNTMLNEMATLYNLLESNASKALNETKMESILDNYLENKFPNYTSQPQTLETYQEIFTTLDSFESFNYETINYYNLAAQNDARLETFLTESIRTTTLDNKQELQDFLDSIQKIKDSLTKTEFENELLTKIETKLTNLDLSNANSIKELMDVINAVNSTKFVDQDFKKLIQNEFSTYINDNPTTIHQLSEGTLYESQTNDLLIKYLTNYNKELVGIPVNTVLEKPTTTPGTGVDITFDDKEILKNIKTMSTELDRINQVTETLQKIIATLNGGNPANSSNSTSSNVNTSKDSTFKNNAYHAVTNISYADNGLLYEQLMSILSDTENNELIVEGIGNTEEYVQLLNEKVDELTDINDAAVIEEAIKEQVDAILKANASLTNDVKNNTQKLTNIQYGMSIMGISLLLVFLGIANNARLSLKNRRESDKNFYALKEQMAALMKEINDLKNGKEK